MMENSSIVNPELERLRGIVDGLKAEVIRQSDCSRGCGYFRHHIRQWPVVGISYVDRC